MNSKLIVYFCLTIVVCGCNDHSNSEWPEKVELGLEVKKKAKPMKAEIVEISRNFIYASRFFVYNDSIMIVSNKPSTDGYFVEFYNLNSNKIINRFIRMGNGPGEMLNVRVHMRNNQLLVDDFAKNQIVAINVDSVLYNSKYRVPLFAKYSNTIGSPFVTPFNDNELIMWNPYYFRNEELDIDNKAPRFIVIKTDEPLPMTLGDYRYYTYNVSQGSVIVNQNKNRVVIASMFNSELALYDILLNPIKLIAGPNKLKPMFSFENEEITFKGMLPFAYVAFYSEDRYLYLSYVGDYWDTREQDLKSYIFKFDWDGNFIESFYSPQYLMSISKSQENDVFYGRGFDEDGLAVLWKLTVE